jgi:hypothetical protein
MEYASHHVKVIHSGSPKGLRSLKVAWTTSTRPSCQLTGFDELLRVVFSYHRESFDDLYANAMMSMQLPDSMFLLLLWIKRLSQFQSNSSIVLPLGAHFWLSRKELLPIVSCFLASREFRPEPSREQDISLHKHYLSACLRTEFLPVAFYS